MASSLQDQLLKAGLSTKQKANDVKTHKHKKTKKQRKTNELEVDQAKLDAEKSRLEQVERDKTLNRKKKLEVERKAIQAQILDMVMQSRVVKGNGDVAYNFVHNKKVKKLYVTEETSTGLSKGQLAIVFSNEGYELVPTVVAEKIRQRDESCVVVCNENATTVADDDPYADFQIPDDLMW